MSDLETLMWRLGESDPKLRATVGVVATFDRPPDPEILSSRLEAVTRRLPRLRDRVDAPVLPTAPPRWQPDPDFVLEHHVTHATTPAGGIGGLLRLAEEAVAAPFPPERPPWTMTFVDGLDGGRSGLVASLHHSYTDGMGALYLAGELFDLQRGPAAARPGVQPSPDPAPPSPLDRAWEDLAFEASRVADAVRRAISWGAGVLCDAAADPHRQVASALDLARSLGAVAARVAGPGSPLMAGRSAGMRLATLELPLDAFRAAGRRYGGTVNDVFVAAVLGGLGRYHDESGSARPSVRVGIPVNARPEGASGRLGNNWRGLVVRAPLSLPDPAERVRLVHDIVREARAQPATAFGGLAAEAAARLPGVAPLAARVLESIEVFASNVAGSTVPLYLAGALVETLVPIGPRGGSGLNVTMLSHDGAVHVGINMDPVATPDTDLLVDCLRAGFDEVLAAG